MLGWLLRSDSAASALRWRAPTDRSLSTFD